MIPAPPVDPSLPGIAALLDEGAVLAMLPAGIRESVTGCRPRYTRYKPGTSCLIQYEFAIVTGETVSAQIRTFSDNRAERRASRSRLKLLQERASEVGPEIGRVAYLPAVNGLLQIFPVDYDLPSLTRAADARRMTKLLRAWLDDGDEITIIGEPETIRYKPARKAMFRYRLRHAPFDILYGKVRSSGHNYSLAAWTNALIEGGVPTPPVAVYLPEHRFVAHPEVAGRQLASLRGQGDYLDRMAPLAETLERLQAIRLEDLPVYRLADFVAEIASKLRWIGAIAPHLDDRFARLGERLRETLTGIDDRLAPAHGDFYDDQVLVDDRGLTLIDLDELRRGHPLLDAGNMLAHLSSGDVRRDEAPGAHSALRDEILRRLPGTERDIAVFEAAALLKLAPGPFRRLEPDWPTGVEHILEVAEGLLDSGQCVSPAPAAIADPALPQLKALQDPGRMAACLEDALGNGPVAIRDIEVVRHKPGRRAILRYRLRDGEHVYGKTFASSRGPKVHEITRQITSARAFGADVALPESVGYLPGLNTLLQREIEGEPVTDLLLGGDRDLGIRIAFTLYQFHTSGLDLGRTHDLAKELSPLPMRRDQVADACPDLQTQVHGCLRRIEAIDVSAFAWRWRPVHRDFYHEQIMLGREGLAVLDLDDAAMSEPAVDVANFVAHLMLLGAQQRRDVSALATVSNGFIGQHCQLDAEIDSRLLTFLMATTLLRLAGIHVTRESGASVARQLLEASAGLLDALPSDMRLNYA
jgi:Ser/Thr protein kinase RdoA (MazF antagonist)